MNEQEAFIAWYTPAEMLTLRAWLIVAAVVNFLLTGIDLLRGDALAAQITMLGTFSLLLLRLMLPNGEARRRDIGMVIAGVTLACGLINLLSSPLSIFDIWLRSWMIIPAAIALLWLSSARVSQWDSGRINVGAAEAGLARNRLMLARYSRIGAHSILLHAVVLVLIPVLWILDVAISPGNALGGALGDAFTGEHFSKILSSESFWLWLRNSLIVSIGTTIFGLVIAVPAGYAFSRWRFRGRDQAMFSFLLVQMFPGVIILVPYFLVMKSLGLLNSNLGLILAYSVTALPLCVWMLKGFFDTIPRELEEAALLDGCNQAQVFTKVVLPLSLPAVAVTALFSFLAAWNEFLLALTFNTSNDMYTLPVGLASLISSTGQAWGDFAAASLLVSLPVVFLFIVFQKFLIQGLSAGGVKG